MKRGPVSWALDPGARGGRNSEGQAVIQPTDMNPQAEDLEEEGKRP